MPTLDLRPYNIAVNVSTAAFRTPEIYMGEVRVFAQKDSPRILVDHLCPYVTNGERFSQTGEPFRVETFFRYRMIEPAHLSGFDEELYERAIKQITEGWSDFFASARELRQFPNYVSPKLWEEFKKTRGSKIVSARKRLRFKAEEWLPQHWLDAARDGNFSPGRNMQYISMRPTDEENTGSLSLARILDESS